ncbi:hypothetical protein OOK13_43755 [Streptomyces sp. NBC_00378]|uniref:hypothetical protein n=1 Tax=unclassified Streptomyces TaxID=2593676 RepID=UPI002256F6D9|nr:MULTISPECIES: hypothetical protein [unclassified Streptomyces]MCX5115244.1 hypothetical protein [Streptomyces sp. NBC_00378]MEE1735496.1 hypothetical protein [Streptomyces sp. BE147]MEE1769266.1 hypothetical protein [Streptomyces sp. JV185]WSY83572.1 hypothetical protein OG782_20090 [Streptomyces sp. NBC_00876]
MAEDRNAELAALARQAVAAAGGLRLLVERMGDLGWRMQDYRDEDLLNVASALRGTAILIALDTEDMDLHEEVTGRRVHEVHDVAEWLREHGEGDGRPLPCRPGPVVPAAGDDPQDGAGGGELAEVESGVASARAGRRAPPPPRAAAARGPGTPFRPSCDSRHCRRLGAAPGPVPPSWGQ